jgi:uncharacterized protein YjgD (DUF1641 family)
MTNPVSKFRNNIFGSRGCNIQEAVDYANELINTLPQTDQVGIRVGFGVLLNTIDNAVAQSQGPSPEKIAIIELIDQRIADKVRDMLAEDDISDQISNWMSNNFDVEDYNVGDAIESWADRNLDEKINEAINNLTFTVNIE